MVSSAQSQMLTDCFLGFLGLAAILTKATRGLHQLPSLCEYKSLITSRIQVNRCLVSKRIALTESCRKWALKLFGSFIHNFALSSSLIIPVSKALRSLTEAESPLIVRCLILILCEWSRCVPTIVEVGSCWIKVSQVKLRLPTIDVHWLRCAAW